MCTLMVDGMAVLFSMLTLGAEVKAPGSSGKQGPEQTLLRLPASSECPLQ